MATADAPPGPRTPPGESPGREAGTGTLQRLCAARGLTLDDLAARARVPRDVVAKIEAGAGRAPPAALGRLAGALGLDRDRLAAELSAARRSRAADPEVSRRACR